MTSVSGDFDLALANSKVTELAAALERSMPWSKTYDRISAGLDLALANSKVTELAAALERSMPWSQTYDRISAHFEQVLTGQGDLAEFAATIADIEQEMVSAMEATESPTEAGHVDRAMVRTLLSYFVVCYVFCWCTLFYLHHRNPVTDTVAALTGLNAWNVARRTAGLTSKVFDHFFPPEQ
jgi:hypothetical protein